MSVTKKQRELCALVRAFVVERTLPLEESPDPDESEVAPETFAALVAETWAMGLYNYDVPAEYGGPGLDTVTTTLLAMEMCQHRGVSAPLVLERSALRDSSSSTTPPPNSTSVLLSGPARQETGLLWPYRTGGGSDPANAIATSAVRNGDEWVLNGTKIFIGEAHRADFGLVFARTGGSGRERISRLSSKPVLLVLKWYGYPYVAIGCDAERDPFQPSSRGRRRFDWQGGWRIRPGERRARVHPYPVLGGVQWMLCDNDMDIHGATLMVLCAASQADDGLSFREETALAKITATEASARGVDRSMQLFGAWGVTKDLPFES